MFVSKISKSLNSCSSKDVIKFNVISAILVAEKGVLILFSHNEISSLNSFALICKNILWLLKTDSIVRTFLIFFEALEKINCSDNLNIGETDKM